MSLTIFLLYIILILFVLITFSDRSIKSIQKIKNHCWNRERENNYVWNIPGPTNFPLFGTKWIYFWKYKMAKIHEAYKAMNKLYGPIVLEVKNGIPIVSLFDRQDIEKVLKYPSKYPFRPPTEIVAHYRMSRPDRYASTGIVNEQGTNWLNLRTKLTPQITSPRVLQSFLPILNLVCDDFIELLRAERNDKMIITNFQEIANLMGLEAVCTLMLGRRMGFLSKTNSTEKNSNVSRLSAAVKNLFISQRDSYFGFGLWKYFPTKTYKEFIKNEEIIYDIVSEMVDQSLEDEQLVSNDNDVRHVFLSILQTPDLDIKDKKSAIIDFIAAGIETLANTLSFILYYIAKNELTQSNIYKDFEYCDNEIKQEDINKAVYTKACIQETYRISPTALCIARILEDNFILSGYNLKPGTVVLCHTLLACQNEKNFKDANIFIPERWIHENDEKEICVKNNEPGSSIVLAFGIGKRTCPGKRFVEMELILIIAKMIKEFSIEYISDLDTQFEFLLAPKSPVNIILKDRN